MNKILNFYQLIVFTNFKKRFYFLIFLSFLSIFAEMFGFIMVIPLTLAFLDSEKGIGVEYLDYLIFNILNNPYQINPLFIIIFLISFFFIAKLILLTFSSYKIFSFSQTLGEKIANMTFLYELNKNYIDQYRVDSSQKIRRTLYDTLQLSSSLSGLILMLSEIIFFILVLGLFLTINMKLFYPVLVIFLVALGYIKFSKNFIYKASQAQQKKYSDWLKFLQEGFGGIKMIKLNNSENFFSEMHATQTSKYFLEEKKLGFMYIFPKIFFEFLLIVSFVLVIISTKFVLNLPNETIIPILALFTVTAIRLIPSIYKIVLNYQKIVQAQPYIAGVYEVFENHSSNIKIDHENNKNHEISFQKNINLSGVNFKYGSNKKKIVETGAVDLIDVLKTIPDINVTQSGPKGQQASLFIRGTGSNHVLVMINGIPINDQSTTQGLHDFGVDFIQAVQQIEIYPGSSASNFGTNSIGGAINIILTGDLKDKYTFFTDKNENYQLLANKNFIFDNSNLNLKFGSVKEENISAQGNIDDEYDGVENYTLNLNYHKYLNANTEFYNTTYLRQTIAEYDNSSTNQTGYEGDNKMCSCPI